MSAQRLTADERKQKAMEAWKRFGRRVHAAGKFDEVWGGIAPSLRARGHHEVAEAVEAHVAELRAKKP